jgi:hypothetical protein
MLMPEATMYLNHNPSGGKDNIGLARQASHVQSIAIAQGMEDTADDEFRSCIYASISSHSS